MNRKKEIAKFFCGVEAFHAFVHAYLWSSGTMLTVFGITATPTWSIVAAIGNAVASVILGIYAWKLSQRRFT